MLGQPISMLIPQVVGFELTGKLPEGATATDLVLTVVEMLRARGVVGRFVEFFGDGLDHLPLADRTTIANMAPEYGATCGIFPIDAESIEYLRLSGRPESQIALVEAYARAQGLFREPGDRACDYTDTLSLDMSTVEPCISGPKRPQDRIALREAKSVVTGHLEAMQAERGTGAAGVAVEKDGASYELRDGAVVIAAITSCTNTSNPAVLVGAGLLARNARERGLAVKPWVKTSFAPGSMVVKDYLEKAGLLGDLEGLGFHIVGFGCTTCIGNSGPLPEEISAAIRDGDLIVSAALSGNRNFEGRVHAEVRMNFLASPPLVVAYAIAGRSDVDFHAEPVGEDEAGAPVYLRDIWPSGHEIQQTIASSISSEMFRKSYEGVFEGDARWQGMEVPAADRFEWDATSTYVQNPPYFDYMSMSPRGIPTIRGARMLALLGDSITTDHISPAGAIKADSPAGHFLQGRQIPPREFNSYGSRRGNHEIMMRGTFANIRLRNRVAPGTEGGWTSHQPSGERMTIYDAAMRYRDEGVPLVVMGGAEYGTGSSRDWAAKGTRLLGVAAVIARSFERSPPVQPRRHGRAAAHVRGRPGRRIARTHPGARLRRRGTGEGREDGRRDRDGAGRQSDAVRREGAHRHPERSGSTTRTAASCTTWSASLRPEPVHDTRAPNDTAETGVIPYESGAGDPSTPITDLPGPTNYAAAFVGAAHASPGPTAHRESNQDD